MFKQAKKMIERAQFGTNKGRIETKSELEHFEKVLQFEFPKALAEIYLTLPIVGIETHYHYLKEREDWECYPMEWMSFKDIVDEVEITASGEHFFSKGFLPIGADVLGGGDYFYIDLKNEKFPIYQCFHDDFSVEKIADSICEIFEHAIIG